MVWDTRVRLVPGVRLDTVTKVLGIAAGLPHEMITLSAGPTAFEVVRVTGAWAEGILTVPEMAHIYLRGSLPDGKTLWQFNYHHEWEDGEPGSTGITAPRPSAEKIAVLRKVVEFFGGDIDYVDGDIDDYNESFPTTHLSGDDDEIAFEVRQKAIASVEPITRADIEALWCWLPS